MKQGFPIKRCHMIGSHTYVCLILSCIVMQCNAMHVRMITYVCLFVSHLIPATYPNKMATNPIVGSIEIYMLIFVKQLINRTLVGYLHH